MAYQTLFANKVNTPVKTTGYVRLFPDKPATKPYVPLFAGNKADNQNKGYTPLFAGQPVVTEQPKVITSPAGTIIKTGSDGLKEITFPERLGGGVYNSVAGQPNKIVNTGHTTYGDTPTKAGYERADIFPVSLGGKNANRKNITYEKNLPSEQQSAFIKTPADKYLEEQVLPALNAGKLSLPEARLKMVTFQQAEPGFGSNPETDNFLQQTAKDTLDTIEGMPAETGKIYGKAFSDIISFLKNIVGKRSESQNFPVSDEAKKNINFAPQEQEAILSPVSPIETLLKKFNVGGTFNDTKIKKATSIYAELIKNGTEPVRASKITGNVVNSGQSFVSPKSFGLITLTDKEREAITKSTQKWYAENASVFLTAPEAKSADFLKGLMKKVPAQQSIIDEAGNIIKTEKPLALSTGEKTIPTVPESVAGHANTKSPFKTVEPLRELNATESIALENVNKLTAGKAIQARIASVPKFVSADKVERPLVLSKPVIEKVTKDHGAIPLENLVINANDWDYAIRNLKGNTDKINLIKTIPNSDNYLTIGANKVNGYFLVTHFETISKSGNELKNLLKKGDVLDKLGRTPSPLEAGHSPFATSPEGAASQLGRLSGVKPNEISILPKKDSVNIDDGLKLLNDALAVKHLTETELEQMRVAVTAFDEALRNDPVRKLSKYSSKAGEFAGGLREVGGQPGQGEFARYGDEIAANLGYSDSEVARQAFEKYQTQRANLNKMKEKLAQLRERKSLAAKGEKLMGIAMSERRMKFRALKGAFDLTDSELAGIRGRRDLSMMTTEEFTDFMNKAHQLADDIQIKHIEQATAQKGTNEHISPMSRIGPSVNFTAGTDNWTSLPAELANRSDILRRVNGIIQNRDVTQTVQYNAQPIEQEPELITTRKFKQTKEWQDFAKYAEENLQSKDIKTAILFRHISLTAERVAEFLDGGVNGEVYKKIIKPVYDSAEKVNREANAIKLEFDKFKILEGGSSDRNASLFAQGKLNEISVNEAYVNKGDIKTKRIEVTPREKAAAKYVRDKYDDFLTRLNDTRAKLGVEPIPKRMDYVTHINELNVLSELFGGMERISTQSLISKLKNELLDQHADWTDARAFDAAKRHVEGLTGIGQYVDARQPSFRFAKERLVDSERNPSIIRSFSAYTSSALRYIHQAENVARNKAFKDVLPANAKEFIRLWNTEQVAGRVPPSFISPKTKRLLSVVKGTIGSNTILGNLATTMMQLTSFPQVFAMAGVKNTFYGISKRLISYLSSSRSFWNISRSKALRNLDIDIGLGDSVVDKLLVSVGKFNVLKDPAARTRQAIDFGRDVLMGIMEMADQFTVGASYEAFYRKAVLDGLLPDNAKEYADIMTGKTQANYFKEALPPFLNTTEGKTIGQFGTYTMNQWEMIRKDLGKEFVSGEKSSRGSQAMFKQFLVFLMSAYLIDAISEKTFGRQPYDVKSLTDETVKTIEGKSSFGNEVGAMTNTVASYLPFMGSVKYKTMPPIFDFGGDVVSATFGSGVTQQTAINNLSEKWIYNILLPYGGNQARKSLQGIQSVSGKDLPFVKNTLKKINISTNIDKAKAILFGPSATQASMDYYNGTTQDRNISIYQKIQELPENQQQAAVDAMTEEQYKDYKSGYSAALKMQQLRMMPTGMKILRHVQELMKQGNRAAARSYLDGLSDPEGEAYKSALKKEGL